MGKGMSTLCLSICKSSEAPNWVRKYFHDEYKKPLSSIQLKSLSAAYVTPTTGIDRNRHTNNIEWLHCFHWYIFTDRVRSTRESYVLTGVCPSICLSTPGGGGYPSQIQQAGGYPSQIQVGGVLQPGPGGGYPSQVQAGGYPNGGVPHLRYPPIGPGRGVPQLGGTPPRVPPPVDLCRGLPQRGGTPPSSTWYAAVGMPLAFTQEDFLVIL